MKRKPVSPGSKAPISGQYEEVGARGGRQGNETTLSKGKVTPPTSKTGHKWLPVDASKNASGRGK